MRCSVHKGEIRGRVHRWNRRPMCGRCYGYFTKRVRVQRTRGVKRVTRKPTLRRNSSLLDRLRALLE
jgi:hypothetical protein